MLKTKLTGGYSFCSFETRNWKIVAAVVEKLRRIFIIALLFIQKQQLIANANGSASSFRQRIVYFSFIISWSLGGFHQFLNQFRVEFFAAFFFASKWIHSFYYCSICLFQWWNCSHRCPSNIILILLLAPMLAAIAFPTFLMQKLHEYLFC